MMRVTEVLQKTNIPDYSTALMSKQPHKNCTSLAESIGQSHDKLYNNFKDPMEKVSELCEQLEDIAKTELSGEEHFLIFDDSTILKPHAKDIEGIDYCFDGCTGDTGLGLQMLTALLSDGNIKIPVELVPYISKKIARLHFRSKSELAAKIYLCLITKFKIDTVLADAHYAVKQFLALLTELGQPFLMKFPCNRVVRIGNKKGQLKEIFRLKRNERFKAIQAEFHGHDYYFYVVKVKPGTIAYFISLDQYDQDELSRLYKIRWGIELFHRTAKQSLGWKECQMISNEKQVLHSFYVMYAYAIAEMVRVKLKFEKTEDAIRAIWDAKAPQATGGFCAAGQNF
jgi:SRSO17 transposase